MTDITDRKSYLAPFKGKEKAALKDAIETRKLGRDGPLLTQNARSR